MKKYVARIRAAYAYVLMFGFVPSYLWLVGLVGPYYSHDLLFAGLLMAVAAVLLPPVWASVAMAVIGMAWQNGHRR